jgi:hypothetical protein
MCVFVLYWFVAPIRAAGHLSSHPKVGCCSPNWWWDDKVIFSASFILFLYFYFLNFNLLLSSKRRRTIRLSKYMTQLYRLMHLNYSMIQQLPGCNKNDRPRSCYLFIYFFLFNLLLFILPLLVQLFRVSLSRLPADGRDRTAELSLYSLAYVYN